MSTYQHRRRLLEMTVGTRFIAFLPLLPFPSPFLLSFPLPSLSLLPSYTCPSPVTFFCPLIFPLVSFPSHFLSVPYLVNPDRGSGERCKLLSGSQTLLVHF